MGVLDDPQALPEAPLSVQVLHPGDVLRYADRSLQNLMVLIDLHMSCEANFANKRNVMPPLPPQFILTLSVNLFILMFGHLRFGKDHRPRDQT